MAEGRPEIPAAVKRAVRQRCGFGCVVCGLPLYTYEHMYDWAKTHSHAEDELTLLCDRHQSERTKGLLPREAVLAANAAPVNTKSGVSEPYDGLHFSGSSGELILGNNRFLSQGMRLVPLLANGEEPLVFDFADGSLKFSAHVRDKDGTAVLLVVENELVYSTDSWDIDFVGRQLTLRNAPGELHFQVRFDPPGRVVISRLDITYGDVRVFVDAQGLHVRGPGVRQRDLANCTMVGGFEYALVLDSHIVTAAGAIL